MILLAEDHGEFREALTRALETDGAVVDAVANGAAALEKLIDQRFRPDVVVSDVRMPRKTGLEVLAALRLAGLTTPVILLTAFGDSVDTATLDRLGGAVLLEKPFDLDDLRTALRNLPAVARRGSRR